MAHAFDEEIVFAVAALRRGEVVAYPTETFYGLGVDALDELALARLRALKGRDEQGDLGAGRRAGMLDRLCSEVPPLAAALMRRYWPGALTIALPARSAACRARSSPTGASPCASRRIPLAQALVAGLGRPLTTTSANRAGEPPATTAEAVEETLRGTVPHSARRRDRRAARPARWSACAGSKLEILRQRRDRN